MSLLLALFSAALPQDAQEKTEIRTEHLSMTEEGDLQVAYLVNAVVRKGDLFFRADHVLLWIGKGKGPEAFRELYAEGHVIYRRGKEGMRAERLYYDRARDRAYLLHFQTRTGAAPGKTPVQLRAREVRQVGKGRFIAEDVRVSTCGYGVPHYDVTFGQGWLVGEKPRKPKSAFDLFPFESWVAGGQGAVPRIRGLPFFYLPGITLSSEIVENFPLRSIRAGSSSRYGTFLLTDWGLRIRKGWVDAILPGATTGDEDDDRAWGDLRWELDWRQERGGAGGLDLDWKWDGYAGYLDTYFLYDLGRADTDFDNKFAPLERKERGRARLFHRHEFLPEWRYEVELSYLSDQDLLEEFFEKEFKESKEQESAAYLRWKSANLGAFALYRPRLNDFQSQLEWLPRLSFLMLQQPVVPSWFERLVVTTAADVSHLRFRFADGLADSDHRTWRGDILNELSLPLDLTYFSLAPYASARATWWEKDLAGEDEFRWLLSAGARLRFDLHRVHDIRWEWIGLHKLRHILQAEVRYSNNLLATKTPDQFFPFDSIDTLNEFQEIAFTLRNRFQTKRLEGKAWKTWEFLEVGLEIEHYPKRAETGTFRPDNFTPPFHWITLTPADLTAGLRPRNWSNLHWDVQVRPSKYFVLTARGEYNLEDAQEEGRELSLNVQPLEGLRIYGSATFLREITDAYTVGIQARLAEKWLLEGRVQYDFRTDEFTRQEVALGRDFHDFLLYFVFDRNELRDDVRFYVTLVPTFLGSKAGAKKNVFR